MMALMEGASSPPAGWYRDPRGKGERWWNGAEWGEETRGAPAAAKFPPVVPAPRGRVLATPADPGASSRATENARFSQPRAFWLSALALAGIAIGSLGPWAETVLSTRSGTDMDGVYFLIGVGLGFGALCWYATAGARVALALPALLGALVIADCIRLYLQFGDGEASPFGFSLDLYDPAWGIYLCAIAAAVLVVSIGLLALRPGAAGPAELRA